MTHWSVRFRVVCIVCWAHVHNYSCASGGKTSGHKGSQAPNCVALSALFIVCTMKFIYRYCMWQMQGKLGNEATRWSVFYNTAFSNAGLALFAVVLCPELEVGPWTGIVEPLKHLLYATTHPLIYCTWAASTHGCLLAVQKSASQHNSTFFPGTHCSIHLCREDTHKTSRDGLSVNIATWIIAGITRKVEQLCIGLHTMDSCTLSRCWLRMVQVWD